MLTGTYKIDEYNIYIYVIYKGHKYAHLDERCFGLIFDPLKISKTVPYFHETCDFIFQIHKFLLDDYLKRKGFVIKHLN